MSNKPDLKKAKPTLKQVTDAKIDEAKLKTHAELVKNPAANKSLVDLKTIHANFKSAVVETRKWAKDNHISSKTQEYLNTLTDVVAVFIKELLK